MTDTKAEVVKFGTDGWRDIIADKFTFENVARAAQAHAQYLKRHGGSSVVVGYDTRFHSAAFARTAAEVMAANGLKTYLAKDYTPTPVLSYAVVFYKAAGGVMITASHNPPAYNGYKMKGAYGGSTTPEIVKGVEAELAQLEPVAKFDASKHSIEMFDVRDAYFKQLDGILDLAALRPYKGIMLHDSMGGAGGGWITDYAKHANLAADVRPVHGPANPMFYGVNPEPITQNLGELLALLKQEQNPTFGAVTDGDADRVGASLAGGLYFNSHQIFCVLLQHLYNKGFRGRVVKTISGTQILNRMAEKLGLELLETAVGFKYITDAFLEGQQDPKKAVLMGGEESGGMAVLGHIPERDGILNSLLLLEAVAVSGKNLGELFSDIEKFVGVTHAYDRHDLHLAEDFDKTALMERLKQGKEISGHTVTDTITKDGVKWLLTGDAWVLFRASGTEPLVRVYCEAPTMEAVNSILAAATKLVTG